MQFSKVQWVFSCDQAALRTPLSVCLSVRLSVCLSVKPFFTMSLSSYHHEIFRSNYQWQKWCPCKRSRSKVKVTEVITQLSRFWTVTPVWMMHKAWCGLEEVLYYFSRSSIKFRGHTDKKNLFWPELGVSGLSLKFEFTNGYEIMHRAWSSIEQLPSCFSRSFVKFQGHTGQKNRRFWPELSVSGLLLQFEFTDGFEMMHKA